MLAPPFFKFYSFFKNFHTTSYRFFSIISFFSFIYFIVSFFLFFSCILFFVYLFFFALYFFSLLFSNFALHSDRFLPIFFFFFKQLFSFHSLSTSLLFTLRTQLFRRSTYFFLSQNLSLYLPLPRFSRSSIPNLWLL